LGGLALVIVTDDTVRYEINLQRNPCALVDKWTLDPLGIECNCSNERAVRANGRSVHPDDFVGHLNTGASRRRRRTTAVTTAPVAVAASSSRGRQRPRLSAACFESLISKNPWAPSSPVGTPVRRVRSN